MASLARIPHPWHVTAGENHMLSVKLHVSLHQLLLQMQLPKKDCNKEHEKNQTFKFNDFVFPFIFSGYIPCGN